MDADILDLLSSIDATLKALLALSQKRTAQVAASAPAAVASDRDLDGRYGDPVLRFMPRDWTGPSFTNCRYSQCPPELLDLVAETCDYFARKSDEKGEITAKGKPVAEFKRADAARARGWAKRMREGRHQAPAVAAADNNQTPEWAEQSEGW